MKTGFLLLAVLLFAGCRKVPEENQKEITEADLTGTKWRIVAFRNGSDTANPGSATWLEVNYQKNISIVDLFCIYDSRVGKSFLSRNNCSYELSPGSIVGVVSADCARTVLKKDTVWSQLTNYDLEFSSNKNFFWLEHYTNSKYTAFYNKSCQSLEIVPEGIRKYESYGKWSFNPVSRMIMVDYGFTFSRLDGEPINRFSVQSFTGNELVIRLITYNLSEYKLRRL
jgi:hypothetical protein